MQPMEGVKVLELSTMITASFAAMMLGEQGASVIKVEPIELGDPMRFWVPKRVASQVSLPTVIGQRSPSVSISNRKKAERSLKS